MTLIKYNIDGVAVTVKNCDDMSEKEAAAYVKHVKESYKNEIIKELTVTLKDNDMVALDTGDVVIPFERIRRITGYLVGTLDRFNDAKRAEESQRVKHWLPDDHGGGGRKF